LRTWAEVSDLVRPGLRALRASHRRLVSRPNGYACSLDLDEARRPADPRSARWDYILGQQDGAGVGVEVHPAKASEVSTVIAKKNWAQGLLRDRCRLEVRRWFWVRPTGSRLQFTPRSAKAHLLAENGIVFPVARLP
jgi:hypothetical protein